MLDANDFHIFIKIYECALTERGGINRVQRTHTHILVLHCSRFFFLLLFCVSFSLFRRFRCCTFCVWSRKEATTRSNIEFIYFLMQCALTSAIRCLVVRCDQIMYLYMIFWCSVWFLFYFIFFVNSLFRILQQTSDGCTHEIKTKRMSHCRREPSAMN